MFSSCCYHCVLEYLHLLFWNIFVLLVLSLWALQVKITPYFQRLGKDANLKTKKTLELLDQYLKHANSQMVKNLLGYVDYQHQFMSTWISLPVF